MTDLAREMQEVTAQLAAEVGMLSTTRLALEKEMSTAIAEFRETLNEVRKDIARVEGTLADLRKRVDVGRREGRERAADQLDAVRLLQAQYLGRLDSARLGLEEAADLLRRQSHP